jgi:hypothetical protein
MTQDIESFFANTGVDESRFANDVKEAKTFGMKIKETFQPEIVSNVNEIKERSQRLNAKQPIILGLPNSFVYIFAVTGLIYIAYNFILD